MTDQEAVYPMRILQFGRLDSDSISVRLLGKKDRMTMLIKSSLNTLKIGLARSVLIITTYMESVK
jgi:hypothetical protein